MARTLADTNWSALIDLQYDVTQLGNPIRITELMYAPIGGDAFEYIELQNTGALPVDLTGSSFQGVHFRFPIPFPELEPGARLVIANGAAPADFQTRYPNVRVAGWYTGALDNGGERIALIDAAGETITSVESSINRPGPTVCVARAQP